MLDLSRNEPPYGAPGPVLEAWRRAADLRRYPDPTAAALRERLAERHRVPTSCVYVSTGSADVLRALAAVLLDPSRLLCIWPPTYALVSTLASRHGSVAQTAKRAGGRLGRIEPVSGLAPGCALAYVATPNNPTGQAEAQADVEAVIGAAAAAGAVAVVDEAYFGFERDCGGDSPYAAVGGTGSHVVVRTFSKRFALAGARVGYALAPADLVEQLDRQAVEYRVPAAAQAAAIAAVDHESDYEPLVAGVVAERDRLRAELLDLGFTVPPSSANFLYVEATDGRVDIADCLRAHGIVVKPFEIDGAHGARITVGTQTQDDLVLAALRELAGRLR